MQYIIKIQKPFDQYHGLLVCPIAFFNSKGDLIYYHKNFNAELLKENCYYKVSRNGRYVYFIERGSNLKDLNHILIDLLERRFKSIKFNDGDDLILDKNYNNRNYNEIELFKSLKWIDAIKDKIKTNSLLGKKLWHEDLITTS